MYCVTCVCLATIANALVACLAAVAPRFQVSKLEGKEVELRREWAALAAERQRIDERRAAVDAETARAEAELLVVANSLAAGFGGTAVAPRAGYGPDSLLALADGDADVRHLLRVAADSGGVATDAAAKHDGTDTRSAGGASEDGGPDSHARHALAPTLRSLARRAAALSLASSAVVEREAAAAARERTLDEKSRALEAREAAIAALLDRCDALVSREASLRASVDVLEGLQAEAEQRRGPSTPGAAVAVATLARGRLDDAAPAQGRSGRRTARSASHSDRLASFTESLRRAGDAAEAAPAAAPEGAPVVEVAARPRPPSSTGQASLLPQPQRRAPARRAVVAVADLVGAGGNGASTLLAALASRDAGVGGSGPLSPMQRLFLPSLLPADASSSSSSAATATAASPSVPAAPGSAARRRIGGGGLQASSSAAWSSMASPPPPRRPALPGSTGPADGAAAAAAAIGSLSSRVDAAAREAALDAREATLVAREAALAAAAAGAAASAAETGGIEAVAAAAPAEALR